MVNREVTLEQLFESYARKIKNLHESEDYAEFEQDALLVLTTRNLFERHALNDEQRVQLDRLDDELTKRWKLFVNFLPLPSRHERRQWWWFLNEGPQVREQAKALAA